MWLLRSHGEALEADFLRHYQIDLLDLYRGTLSPRRARVLALHLPPGAATWLAAGTDTAWSVGDYILADLYDATVAIAHGDSKGPKPKHYPRPADARAQQEEREATLAKAARFRSRAKRQRPQPN